MKAEWGTQDSQAWDAAHAQAAGPLQQDWAYGSTMLVSGGTVIRAVIQADGHTVGLAQCVVRRFANVGGVALCTRGPLWLAPLSGKDKAHAYRSLRQSLPVKGLRFMFVTPNEPISQDLGLSPFKRVMTGYSTALLDLSPSMADLRAGLEKRFRHRVGGAEKSELTVHRVGTNVGQYRWLMDAEQLQRDNRGLQGMPLHFVDAYIASRKQPGHNVLTLRADIGRDRVAGMMFLLHGQAATYQIGWTSDAGRDAHAHNLLLYKGMEALKERGIRSLDMGGINTGRSAGIARFKISTGAKVVTFAGTYLV
jgi:lipid II:glycine glycyltransferase (peptidoglycan interpeptide bridge formation enzyme)